MMKVIYAVNEVGCCSVAYVVCSMVKLIYVFYVVEAVCCSVIYVVCPKTDVCCMIKLIYVLCSML
jgi:hypothetical protein